FLLLIVLLALGSPTIYAQRSRDIAYIGKINLKAVVMLHPAMTSYDPGVQAFKVDATRVPQQQMQQKASQHQAELNELTSTIKSLQGRISETHRNYDRQIEELSTRYTSGLEELATGPAALRRQDYLIDQGRAEAAYHARLIALGAQLSTAEEKYEKLSRIAYTVGYTDPDETKRKFSAIINEIRQYTQQIAVQKNVQVVLNTSLSSVLARTRETVVAPDLDYGKVFAVPFPREIANDSAAVAGYYGNISSMAANWLSNSDKILEPFKAAMLDNDVFIGGVDLTSEVLAAIFKAYKIDPNIGNAVIQSVNLN
ncbi:MAG: hypothetical protein PHD82_10185, partial [Candidatus Riflebacteria bacterium]|nr:hypothetical protein [Candidatus Riflebacteria bacterium]